MTEPQIEGIAKVRAAIVKDCCEAQEAFDAAKKRLDESNLRLRMFDEAISISQQHPEIQPASSAKEAEVLVKAYTKGRTIAVRGAVTSFNGEPFTPEQLRQRIIQLTPVAADLFPDTTSVTRVLNKLLVSDEGFLTRVTKGAGVKEPSYANQPTSTSNPKPTIT